jgi:hypothetical protein
MARKQACLGHVDSFNSHAGASRTGLGVGEPRRLPPALDTAPDFSGGRVGVVCLRICNERVNWGCLREGPVRGGRLGTEDLRVSVNDAANRRLSRSVPLHRWLDGVDNALSISEATLSREARRKELAVRAALGADRGGLVRQVSAEGLLLAVAAGGLALAVAWGSLQALITLIPDDCPASTP